MKAFIYSKSFILATMLAIAISTSSMVAFRKTAVVCEKANQSCSKGPSGFNGEILWDKVAKHFTSLIFIQ